MLQLTDHERALKEFQCKLCSSVLQQPISTPCGHHFCKPCIEKIFKVKTPAGTLSRHSGNCTYVTAASLTAHGRQNGLIKDNAFSCLLKASSLSRYLRLGAITFSVASRCMTLLQGVGEFEVRANNAGRPLRERKSLKPCPHCKADIADFLRNSQVNR